MQGLKTENVMEEVVKVECMEIKNKVERCSRLVEGRKDKLGINTAVERKIRGNYGIVVNNEEERSIVTQRNKQRRK